MWSKKKKKRKVAETQATAIVSPKTITISPPLIERNGGTDFANFSLAHPVHKGEGANSFSPCFSWGVRSIPSNFPHFFSVQKNEGFSSLDGEGGDLGPLADSDHQEEVDRQKKRGLFTFLPCSNSLNLSLPRNIRSVSQFFLFLL